MPRRIVLIRAVNLGGTGRLPMADLRMLATDLGATEVGTYIASGNLLCRPPGDSRDAVDAFDRALESAIEARFGFFREVISRSRAEVQAALAAHPFRIIEPKWSYVTFLAGRPAADAIEAAARYQTPDDEWRVIGRELHIRYAVGAGRTGLDAAAIGRTLGVAGTARNLLTVQKLIELSA